MSDLKVFESEEFGTIGVMVIDGKDMFPATECACKLGYVNPNDAISRHTRGGVKRAVLTLGAEQQMNFISKGYALSAYPLGRSGNDSHNGKRTL